MRAILINPYTREVTETAVNPGLDKPGGMYEVMRGADPQFSGLVECVQLGPNVDLWIDEEGCLSEGRPAWRFQGETQLFAGAALTLCRDMDGETIALHVGVSLEGARAIIQFTNLETTGDFGPSREEITEHPIFGPTPTFIGGQPIYRERQEPQA